MKKADAICKDWTIPLGLALINILLHLAFYSTLEYHRDELLYFSLGMHPDFGYATVPPMIGWIASLMQWLFGYSLFAVKIFPALLSGIYTWIAILIARELGGKRYAIVLTGIAIIVMPFGLRAFHLFQPVCIELVFWSLIVYCILRYLNSGEDKFLMMTGALCGLAMLNKYLVALLIISLLLSLLITRNFEIIRKRAFYLGCFIGIIIFFPNFIWQIVNGLPVINHMNELNETQLMNVNRFDFLIEQLLSPFPATLVILPGLFYILGIKKFRFLGVTAILVVFILLIMKGKSYYSLGVMAFLVAAGAVFFEKFIKQKLIRIAIPVLLVLIAVPIFPLGIPAFNTDGLVHYFNYLEDHYDLTVGRRFEDGSIHSLPQDYADQLGWDELTRHASIAWQQIPEKEKGLIYCENYGQAGAIAVIGKKYGLPEPLSFSESFAYWLPDSFHPDIEYAIYINDEMGEDVKALFSEISVIGKIENIHAREFGTTVYLCSKPVMSFNEFWQSRLKEEE